MTNHEKISQGICPTCSATLRYGVNEDRRYCDDCNARYCFRDDDDSWHIAINYPEEPKDGEIIFFLKKDFYGYNGYEWVKLSEKLIARMILFPFL